MSISKNSEGKICEVGNGVCFIMGLGYFYPLDEVQKRVKKIIKHVENLAVERGPQNRLTYNNIKNIILEQFPK